MVSRAVMWGAVGACVLMGCAKGHEATPCDTSATCGSTEACIDGLCQRVIRDDTDAGGEDAGPLPDGGRSDASSPDASAGDAAGPDGGFDGGFDAGPSCTDGLRNGDETDVDCGGSCSACAECAGCASDADCQLGQCDDAGRCRLRREIYVDWLTHCSTDGSAQIDVAGVPAGDYVVTALDSAATVWNPPYSPPTNGWFYRVPCEALAADGLRTPAGTYYASESEAFANLVATTQVVSFAGGPLTCKVLDSNCTDNHGGARFAIQPSCP